MYGEDNESVVLNANRTTMKYVAEGESNGPQKLRPSRATKRLTRLTSASQQVSKSASQQVSKAGVLTLSNRGDFFRYATDSAAGRVNRK